MVYILQRLQSSQNTDTKKNLETRLLIYDRTTKTDGFSMCLVLAGFSCYLHPVYKLKSHEGTSVLKNRKQMIFTAVFLRASAL